MVAAEFRQRLEEELKALPQLRGAIMLLTIDGVPPATIADLLTIDVKVVYREQFRARNELERKLGLPERNPAAVPLS